MAYTFKHGDRPVDGYTIQRAVGKGGFGEVYYAMSDGGREVAIKYLRDNPQVELRGVSHCINLKSPHLVSIFDVRKTTDGEFAIIMEYCSGPSLRDLLIAEPNGFDPQKAAFFVREIAKGLSYLHDRGIVHRDLKPGNIFYDDGYVKIGDYGLSKFISVSRHSGQTASVGTVHYMAPEIGSGNYSKGVDIYALGVMLYEMLLGKVPFEGSSMAEVLMKHLTTQPELDELPQPFGRIIRKALEKDPNDRYQSADEMVTDLLEVDEVRESLAGFRPQSLEGAVRGEAARADSPMPSPNPIPGYGPDVVRPAGGGSGLPPYAKPVGGHVRIPERLGKKVDRISWKMDAKMAKLTGRPHRRSMRRRHAAAGAPGAPTASAAPSLMATDRRKRMLLAGLMSIGLAVGLGVLVGTTYGGSHNEEMGAAAGMLVIAMSGGIVLSRSAIKWFGAQYGPKWSQRMIAACCCAPLMAIGTAPVFAECDSRDGAAMWLGLLFLAVFGSWTKDPEQGPTGEICVWSALWKAFWALVWTTIAAGVVGGEPDSFVFVSAGIAGAASLVIQATSWWLPSRRARAFGQFGSRADADHVADGGAHAVPPPPPPYEQAVGQSGEEPASPPPGEAWTPAAAASLAAHPRLRWGVTRAFWGLVAFVLMGGAIVTFLIPLIAVDFDHHEITASVIACTGFASFMIFALRKTTPIKRDGFWRETLRPFLISLMMLGIGGTITGIAREWSHSTYCNWSDRVVRCVPDEGRVALVAGLVMCSVVFLGLLLFTGRRRRAPKPFLIDDSAGRNEPDSSTSTSDEAPQVGEPGRDIRALDGGAANKPVRPGTTTGALRPHRGVAVLVLGILGINLFPLGIAAWVMGHRDLLEMDTGRMDPSGRGITSAGEICGMIGVVIACAGALVGLVLLAAMSTGVIR